MNRFIVAAVATIVTLSTAANACDVTEQVSVSEERFYDPTSFGRLGIESRSGYLRLIDRVACFDASDYQRRSTLNLHFNHATINDEHTNAPSYLAAQVITATPNRQSPVELSLYRSPNDRTNRERGLWVHPKNFDHLPSRSEFSSYADNELAFAERWTDQSGFREPTNGDFDLYVSNRPGFGGQTYKQFVDRYGKWHALLVNRSDLRGSMNGNGRSRNGNGRDNESGADRSYRVVHNTWEDRNMWGLPTEELNGLIRQGNSYRVRQYLIHYRPFLKQPGSGAVPRYRVSIPIGSRDASCIYIRTMGPNSVGTHFAIAGSFTHRFIALRVNPNAECIAPPPPPSAWNLFSRRTAQRTANRQ